MNCINLLYHLIFSAKNKIYQSTERHKDGHQHPNEFVIAFKFGSDDIYDGKNHKEPKRKYDNLPKNQTERR